MSDHRPLTTRRGFITAAGCGVLSLYGLWAAYGVAPLPFVGGHKEGGDAGQAGHAGHGAAPEPAAAAHAEHGGGAAAGQPTPDEFRRLTEEFVLKYRHPDGTVWPGVEHSADMDHGDHGGHGGHGDQGHGDQGHGAEQPAAGNHADHGHGKMTEADHAKLHAEHVASGEAARHGHADHGQMGHGQMGQGQMDQGGHDAHADHEAAPEVYLMAQQWSFVPTVLRLEAGKKYKFRMMGVDTIHGAAIKLGAASHIMRLPKGVLVEHEIKIDRPGEYLLYCTAFCGVGHDRMSGKIIVA